jgi:DNA replication protein DnaC
MPEKIEETLKKLAAGTSKGSSQTSGIPEKPTSQAGDPDCPHCGGLGYIRRDLPVGHPDFGRLELCECRHADLRALIRSRLFRFSNLDELQHLTFETFNPQGRVGIGEQQQQSIEYAYNLAHTYAQSLEGWLLLQGPFGCGKTHLAAAIANYCVSLGVPTLFLTVPDLLDTLRFAYGDENVTFEERFDQIRTATLLILDDFGTQSATEWAREKLFQILNYRYINRLSTVVTTNLALAQIDGRMRSRLSDPDLVFHIEINAPDYRRSKDESGQSELSSLQDHSHQTFGAWNDRRQEKLQAEDRKTLNELFHAALTFSEDPQGWLVLMGPYGCGKTHLAAAIANFRADQGYPVMFVVIPDLLDHLRATFNPSSTVTYDRRFEEIRNAPLLVLDDLGTEATTPWVREKLYQLFNHRYNKKLPTVITTSATLDEIDPRLRSRLGDQSLVKGFRTESPAFRGNKKRKNAKR